MRPHQLAARARLIVFLLTCVLAAPVSVTLAGQATPGTPEFVPSPPGFTIDELTTFTVTNQDGELVGWYLVSEITLAEGTEAPEAHSLSGTFVTTVISGTICYTSYGTLGTGDMEIASATTPAAGISCGDDALTTCQAPSGCVLQEMDTVTLPAGSTVMQTGGTEHTWSNPDSTTPAVVRVVGFIPPPDGSSCIGTCWRW